MSEVSFGERLAEARRIKGETIEEVSEQLRIRPSIILAMETGNFSHMPHKGYTRNMVSSYSRYLGLDSTRITEQFLREFRHWEGSGGKRFSAVGNSSSLSRVSNRNKDSADALPEPGRKADGRETISAADRNKTRSSVWNRDEKRDVGREFSSHLKQAQDDNLPIQGKGVRRVGARQPANAHSKQLRTNDYVGKPPRQGLFAGIAANLFSRPVLLIVGLVAVFLAILVIWAVLASTCARNDTVNTPVTGASSSDTGLESSGIGENLPDIEEEIAEDNKYGPFELLVEVVDGASWLQIDVDGTTPVADICSPPWSGSYNVTTSCRIEAGAPGYLKVYRNGLEVPVENIDGLGVVELEVEQRPIVQNAQNADAANN